MANIKYINGNPIVATAVELADGSLSGAALTDGSVGGAKIADGAVTLAKLGNDVVIEPPDGSITNAKLAQTGGILSEVQDTRTDDNGIAYPSAGDAIRSLVSDKTMLFQHGWSVAPYGTIQARSERCTAFLSQITEPVRIRIFVDGYSIALYKWVSDSTRRDLSTSISDGYIISDTTARYSIVARKRADNSLEISDEDIDEITNGVLVEHLYKSSETIDVVKQATGTTALRFERGVFNTSNIDDNMDGSATATKYGSKRVRSEIFTVGSPSTIALDADGMRMSVIGESGAVVTGVTSAQITDTDQRYRVSIYKDDNTQVISDDEFNSIRSLTVNADGSLYSRVARLEGIDQFSGRLMGIFTSFTTVGDSLTCGYTSKGGVAHNSAEAKEAGNNWPTYLQLELGRTFTNVGVGGSSVKDWRATHLPTADIPTNCYLVGLGVNDSRQRLTVGTSGDIATDKSDNADSFYGNYDYLIRSLLEYNPKSHVFAFTIPNTESRANDYNNAIRYVVGLYDRVHLIDLYNLYSDVYSSSFLANVWDKHSTPMGYMYMAQMIKSAINDYMLQNYSLFNSVPYE